MFEKKPLISKLASVLLAASVVSVGQAQVKPKSASTMPETAAKAQATTAERQQATNTLSKHREAFIENAGQWDSAAKFLFRRAGMDVWVKNSGWRVDAFRKEKQDRVGHVFDLNFIGAGKAAVKGADQDNMVWDYMGRDGKGKTHRASGYREVKVAGLYSGVDAVYRVDSGSPRFDLHVRPNTNPSVIKIGVKGGDGIQVSPKGELEVRTSLGDVNLGGLKAYQTVNGVQKPVQASFAVNKAGQVEFKIGSYDKSKELVIDPIIYGTYFGGDGGWDELHACVTDTSQGTYITGSTQESEFPANFGPYSLTINGIQDAFVAKLQGDVYNRDYAAIFGGSGSDQGDYIQVDRQGNVWIAGLSDSVDFPGSAQDTLIVVKQDTNATGGTVQFTLRDLRTGVTSSFVLPYNFTAAQLQASIRGRYPNATVVQNNNNFEVTIPYPDRATLSINSRDTWARLTNSPVGGTAYFLQAGKPTAASAGNFRLTGVRNGNQFTTTAIAYNTTPAQLGDALLAASGVAWSVGFEPLATGTPAFPATGIIVVAPGGCSITSIDQGPLTGTIYMGKLAAIAVNTDKTHSAPTGGSFVVSASTNIGTRQASIGWPGLNLPAATFQTGLNAALAATNLRYALVLPKGAATPQNGALTVFTAQEGESLTAPLPAPFVQFLPSGNSGPFTLLPRPNYFSSSQSGIAYRYGYLMRWKKDASTVLSPEVGTERVVTWRCKDADVTINGFNVYKSSDTPSDENVPFTIAGTNFRGGAGDPSPVKYEYNNPTGRVSKFINGFINDTSYSYKLRLVFNPKTNFFAVQNTPNGAGIAQSGYEGDSASAPIIIRGSTVDSFGNQVIAGTVFYNSNFDTRNPGTPFITTSNAYTTEGFDGRLLRADDIFVRRFKPDGTLDSSALIGGNSNDVAGGFDVPKEMVNSPNPLSPFASWPPNGTGFAFQETITGSCVAVDNLNNVYVTGVSGSFNFPRTRGVFGETFDQFARVAVTKLTPDFSALLYSTHLRTSNSVLPGGIGVGPGGIAFVTGNIHPWTVDFPHPSNTDIWGNAPTGIGDSTITTTADALRPAYTKTATPDLPGSDGWLTVLNNTATGLVYSSYVGSELDDVLYQPYVDKFGDCWLAGWTCTRRDILLWPSHTATSGTRYLVDSNLGKVYGGGASQITALAFKTNTDLSVQLEDTIAYGILDRRIGAQLPFVFPPPNEPYPGYYAEARDGFLQRYRFNLPVLTAVNFDKPTLAGGLGNNATGRVFLSAVAPAPGISITITMKNNTAASFDGAGPVFQKVITVPTGSNVGTFTVFTGTVATLTSVDISASFEGNVKVGRLVVAPWFSSLAITPNSAVGGQDVQGRVRLFENAPTAGVPVSLVSSDTNLATVPASVTVPSGQKEAAFVIKTKGVQLNSIAQISAVFAGYGGQQQLTLIPASLFTLTFDPTIVDGRTEAVGTIKLDGSAGKKFSISPVAGSLPSGFSISPNPIIFDPADATQDPSVRTFTLKTPFVTSDTNLVVKFQRNDNPSQTLTGQIQVLADPVTAVQVNKTEVNGGEDSSLSVSIGLPAAKGGALVHVVSDNAAAKLTSYLGVKGTSVLVKIPEGATTASFPISTSLGVDDVKVNFKADRGVVVKGTPTPLTIKGIDVALTLNPTSVAGGSTSTGTVTLTHTAPAGGLTVALSSANTAIAKVPATVAVPAGAIKATFAVTTVQPASGVTTTTTITAKLNTKVSTADITVRAPQPASLTFNPTTVTGGNTTVATLTLDSAAQAGGAKVTLTNSAPTVATVPATVTVPAGKTSVTFNVVSKVVSTAKTTTVGATYNGATTQGTLTVVPATISSVAFSPSTVTGGTISKCTVTLNTPAPVGGAVVTLTNSNGTIATVPATVTIPAGQLSVTFNVQTQPVSRTLSTTVSAKYNGSQGAAILTITP